MMILNKFKKMITLIDFCDRVFWGEKKKAYKTVLETFFFFFFLIETTRNKYEKKLTSSRNYFHPDL